MTMPKRTTGFILSLAALAAPLILVWKAEALVDWWKLHGYTPPSDVAQLAQKDAMTSKAERYFYLNHPQIASSIDQFRQDCPQSEQTIVLGCYHAGENGIAVYDVKDPRLAGVEEVTAAHETLHAAYERLSTNDKTYIDGLLMNYYQHDLKDPRIIDTMNAYKQSEPNDVVNEMHSVFGTEIANLPAPLENYYKQYFTNRAVITAFASGYETEFTSRINQIKAYDQKLTALKQQISQEETALDTQSNQIEGDRQRLDELRNSGQIQAYNSQVDVFNAEVNGYNQALARLKKDISYYNNLVNQRNAIASDLRSLDSALDTRLNTQPAQ